MKDIAPKLLETLRNNFEENMSGNPELKKLLEKITSDNANYEDAGNYAFEVGDALAKSFGQNLSSVVLPDGKMYFNIADRVVRPMLEEDFELVNNAAVQVQKTLNQKAGVGIKAQEADLNEEGIDNILNKITAADKFDDVAWMLNDPVKTFSQSVVDDVLKKNVEFQGKAGMEPMVIRKAESKCCKWCSSLAGKYPYPDVPNDVYRRHNNCRCIVDYSPDGKKHQNVHTKRWRDPEVNAKIEERKVIGKSQDPLTSQERSVRANWQLSATSKKNEGTFREELGSVPVERTVETIQYFNEQIRNESVEHAIVVDKSGKVVHFVGDDKSVGIYDVDLQGASITHNHPASNGITSFGADDFYFLQQNQDVDQFVCCNLKYDYTLRIVKPLDDISYNEIYIEAMRNHVEGEDLQDEAMEVLKLRGYVEYDKSRA